MPRVSPLRVVQMDGYLGGLNKDADVARLEENETPQALNVTIGLRGEVSKRQGYSRFDTNLANEVTHLWSWRDGQSREWLMAVDEAGQIRYVQDTNQAFTDSGKNLGVGGSAARHPIGWAVAQGFIYISSRRGHDSLKWNGTTWTTVAAVPKAQFLKWRFDQLFAANIVNEPSQLRISLELQPENFTDTPAIFDFDKADGTEIRQLAASGDDLLVFKDHSIYIFSGRVRSDFQQYRLDNLRGTFSPRTVKQVRGLLIFFDRDTGVWAWDGSEFTLISEKINQYLLNNITYDACYMAVGHVWRDSYILSVPWQSSQVNQRSFVFSTLTQAWTEWDYGAWDAENHVNHSFIASPRAENGIYEANAGFTDAGLPITMDFRTPWLNPGGPGALSRLRRLETNLVATGASVTVELAQEYDPAPVLSRTLVAVNNNKVSEASVIKNLDGWARRADAHQLRFMTSDPVDFQLNAAHAIFSVNADMLGEHV